MRFRSTAFCFAFLVAASALWAEPRYYGFYDCDNECMDQVHTFTNVAMIRVHIANPALDAATINHAKSLGMKVILSYFPPYLQKLWQENTPGQQKEWENWTKTIKPYSEEIVAIYPYDEPYLKAIMKVGHLRDVPKNRQTQLAREAKANLEMAKGRIRTSFPGIPLIYNEAFVMVNEDLQLPGDYNWIGFDCYKDFDNCQGKSIPEYFEVLSRKATRGQKFVAVIPAMLQLHTGEAISGGEAARLKRQLDKYADLVRRDPRFVAVLAWTYEVYPHPDGTEYRGYKGLGELRSEYARFGHEIGIK